MHEAEQGLFFVAGQSLENREGIDGKSDAIDERVPAMGAAGVDRAKIAHEKSMIAQGAEAFDLALADATAGGLECLEDGFGSHGLVEGDELAGFVAAGVAI